jgi:hypothetical protein
MRYSREQGGNQGVWSTVLMRMAHKGVMAKTLDVARPLRFGMAGNKGVWLDGCFGVARGLLPLFVRLFPS